MPDDQTPAEDQAAPDAEGAEAEAEALKAEVAALKEQVLRYAAEAENTHRRAEREANDARAYAIQRFAKDLLGAADNRENALKHAPGDSVDVAVRSVAQGVEMTEKALQSAFVKAALLKGLDRRRVIFFHVLPVALGPTLSVIALSIGWMAGGLVIVESLFGYPGIGRLLVFVIRNRDIPLLQAISHATAKAAMFMAAGLIYATLGHDRTAELRGAGRALPMTMAAFALAGASLVGLPPSGGFLAK